MTFDIVRPDSSGRISLARFGVEPGQTFEVSEDEGGRIKLTPVKNYLQQFADLPIGQAFKLPGEHSGGLGMRLSYAERDRIAETVIENYGGGERINTDMDDGVFDVSAVKRLIREGIWIAGIEAENAPDIVPGSEEALIQREVEARPVGGDPSFGQKITVRRAEPQHGQTGYATGNGMGHG